VLLDKRAGRDSTRTTAVTRLVWRDSTAWPSSGSG